MLILLTRSRSGPAFHQSSHEMISETSSFDTSWTLTIRVSTAKNVFFHSNRSYAHLDVFAISSRCQCRGESSPADGAGYAATNAGPSRFFRSAVGRGGFGVGRSTGKHEHTALMAGNPLAARISWMITDATKSLELTVQPYFVHQHGEMTCVFRSSKCGLRGVCVGEASNPGPQHHDANPPVRMMMICPRHCLWSRLFPVRSCWMQQDLSDNRHRRRMRRRVVLSDDDALVPQSGPAAVVSRRVVLDSKAGDTRGSIQGRRFRGQVRDAQCQCLLVLTCSQ